MAKQRWDSVGSNQFIRQRTGQFFCNPVRRFFFISRQFRLSVEFMSQLFQILMMAHRPSIRLTFLAWASSIIVQRCSPDVKRGSGISAALRTHLCFLTGRFPGQSRQGAGPSFPLSGKILHGLICAHRKSLLCYDKSQICLQGGNHV